ncbi:unnamed protein product [Amoebophrya sp. A25]|nr:unnamed protein product [Amoebophrya sp. A25]|eukprot:GSA25T00013305001.1
MTSLSEQPRAGAWTMRRGGSKDEPPTANRIPILLGGAHERPRRRRTGLKASATLVLASCAGAPSLVLADGVAARTTDVAKKGMERKIASAAQTLSPSSNLHPDPEGQGTTAKVQHLNEFEEHGKTSTNQQVEVIRSPLRGTRPTSSKEAEADNQERAKRLDHLEERGLAGAVAAAPRIDEEDHHDEDAVYVSSSSRDEKNHHHDGDVVEEVSSSSHVDRRGGVLLQREQKQDTSKKFTSRSASRRMGRRVAGTAGGQLKKISQDAARFLASKRQPTEQLESFFSTETLTTVQPSLQRIPDLAETEYKQLLTNFVENQSSRYIGDPGNGQARQFIKEYFHEIPGLTVSEQSFSCGQTSQCKNVVAVLHPQANKPVVVVGAHYDSRPFGSVAPGADDNASGTVAMMLAAKKAAQFFHEQQANASMQQRFPIYFVAFSAEEEGLYGSAAFAQKLKDDGIAVKQALIMDQVGYQKNASGPNGFIFETTGERPSTAEGTALVESKRRVLEQEKRKRSSSTSETTKEEVENSKANGTSTSRFSKSHAGTKTSSSKTGPPQQHLINLLGELSERLIPQASKLDLNVNYHGFGSDHISMLNAGFPAVLLIERDNLYAEDQFGHTTQDTLDKITWPFATKIARLAEYAAIELAAEDATS